MRNNDSVQCGVAIGPAHDISSRRGYIDGFLSDSLAGCGKINLSGTFCRDALQSIFVRPSSSLPTTRSPVVRFQESRRVPVSDVFPKCVLFEDNHCLVVNKPPRLLTVADQTEHENLLDLAKDYLKEKYKKPGDVFLGVVHRLDRPVSGVVLFARTSKAASRLADQFRTRSTQKLYWALVSGNVVPSSGKLEDWILKDEDENLSSITKPGAAGAKQCSLRYEEIPLAGGPTLLEVRLETGRSHQIRVQLSSRKWPIAGDRKYGSSLTGGGTIGLHAVELTFMHPVRNEPITVAAPPPESWAKWNPRVAAWFEQCHRK